MAYDKQVFIANQTLKAEELNKMNDQIEANEIAISSKQNTLVSGTNIKTINGQSILGEGDITISGNGEAIDLSAYATKVELNNKYTKPSAGIPKTDLSTDVQNALTKANSAGTGTVTAVKINGVTKNPSNGVVDLGEISGGTLSDNTVIGWFKDGDESNDWTPSGGGSLTIGGASYTLGEYDDQGNLVKSAFGAGELNVGGTINLGKHDNGFCGVLNCGDINSGGNMNFYAFGQGINGITDIRFGQLGPVLSIDTLVRSNTLNVRANLIPVKDSLITTCDLGSSSSKWDNVYATNFKGTADSANKVNNALTIKNGSTTITYDGSSAKSITINTNNTNTGTTESVNTSLFNFANTHISITANSPTGTLYDNNIPTDVSSDRNYIGEEKFIYKTLNPSIPYFVNITVIPNDNVIKIVPTGSISDKSFTVTYNTDYAKFEYSLRFDLPSGPTNVITGAPTPGTDPFLDSQLFEFKALVLDGETVKTVDASLPLYFNA